MFFFAFEHIFDKMKVFMLSILVKIPEHIPFELRNTSHTELCPSLTPRGWHAIGFDCRHTHK